MTQNPDFMRGFPLEALDGREGPALRQPDAEREAFVQAILQRVYRPRRVRLERKRLSALLLAAALGVTGVSAAFVVARSWPSASMPAAAPVGVVHTPRASTRLPSRSRPTALGPNSADALPTTEARSASSTRSSLRAAPPSPDSLPELLKAANQWRRQGRWTEAERAYSQVASSYGGSAQGPVAALAAASLRHERLGDPRGAFRDNRTALGSSALAAEALLGIADCQRALGDPTAEMAALRELTSAYPGAMFHERASRRLRALEAQNP